MEGLLVKTVIYVLLNYINCTFKEDTYYYIAQQLLLNLEKIQLMRLEDVAILCDCSYSTINRFCKKIGFTNYSTFREIVRIQRDSLFPVIKNQDYCVQNIMNQIDQIEINHILAFNKIIRDSSRIVLLGYGEFQYTSLYYQKQMYTLNKLIEVKNVYLDNFNFSKLKENDLLILVSMNGEFLKPNYSYFNRIQCRKIILTKRHEIDFLQNFEEAIVLPECSEYYNKYILFRIYERLIYNYINISKY